MPAELNRTHLGINIVSTLFPGGINYCMQYLVAPTRSEIARAHNKGRWLDIGIPSLHNLRNIAKHKRFLWLILGLSSVPLHLMYVVGFHIPTPQGLLTSYRYNSVFYSSLGATTIGLVMSRRTLSTESSPLGWILVAMAPNPVYMRFTGIYLLETDLATKNASKRTPAIYRPNIGI